jgi:hypothetical protein
MMKRTTRADYAVWVGLFIIAVLVTLAVKYYPYFPGDVAVERWVQSLVPANLNWAEAVSRTAEFPWILLILALIFALSWDLAGWRGALLSILSLVGMWVLGAVLSPAIGRPRPSPELVRVFRPLAGCSFPSLFALRYAATFGFLAILVAVKSSGALRSCLLTVCGALLILGFVARVALAAHWPSDVIIFPLLEIPTGDADRGLGNRRAWGKLPLWLQKSWGPWTTYGGGGYAINPAPEQRDYFFGGWLLQRDLGERLTLGGEIFAQGRSSDDTRSFAVFNLGGIVKITPNFHLLFTGGHTLTGGSHTIGYLGLYWTGGLGKGRRIHTGPKSLSSPLGGE